MQTNSRSYLKLVVALLASATCGLAQTNSVDNSQAPAQQGSVQQGSKKRNPEPEAPVRAGFVNYVEGQVSVNGQDLNLQSVGHVALEKGQSIQTGSNGYAEVLLTPGAFLRVGPNSECSMTAVGLADTRVQLTRGSALVEADQIINGTHLEVTLGRTSVDILKKGLYGLTSDPPAVKTFDGKADVIGLAKSREIGKHNQILLAGNDSLTKTSFDEKQAKADPLYVWSDARSRDESAQNKLVAQNSDGYTPTAAGWFWDPYANYYGFWPAGSLYSPFGFGFYGGFYPGFYGGYYGGYHPGFIGRGRYIGGGRTFGGFHGNGVAGGFHGGGFHGGGFHGGGGGRR